MLREVRTEGLRYVEITTDPGNVASQRVIEKNGGVLVEEFVKPAGFGGSRGLRYRVNIHGHGEDEADERR
jgi:predicted acetyltransferase